MIAAVYVLYILTCLFLVMVVLLQAGKGDSMGAVFGGSSGTILGNRGAATFLSKLTVGSAVMFMVLSIFLAYHSSSVGSRVGRGRVNPNEVPAAAGATLDDEPGEPLELVEEGLLDEEELGSEEAVPEEPAVDEPVVDEPAVDEPVVDEPAAEEPAPEAA